MPGYKIDRFVGMLPRDNPKVLPPNVPQLARDVDLDQGTLRPWREPLPVHEFSGEGPALSFARFDCCWLKGDGCSSFVHPWPSCPYVIEAGGSLPWPRIATFEEACADNWCRLGIECPTIAPMAQPVTSAIPGRTLEQRAYRYSWVNKYGQEGGGSPPSIVFSTNDGASVVVQLPPGPSPEYCVVATRIYRLATPFESGGETSNPNNTEWFLVDEVPISTTSYLDTKRLIDLGMLGVLPTFTNEEYLPPPADLRGIVNLENGMIAGISGDYIYFCDPFNPHNWPLRLIKQLYDTPVALAAIADVLYIGTSGRPYTMLAKQDCNNVGCMATYRHREPLPCISPRSMVAGAGVVLYASEDGLVLLAGNKAKVISEALYTKRQWQALHPNRMIGASYNGYYMGFTDIVGIRLRTPEDEHFDPRAAALTTLSDRPDAVWRSEEGFLYFAFGNTIAEWNAGARYRPYFWSGSIQHTPRRITYRAAFADRDPEGDLTVTLLGRQPTIEYTTRIDTPAVFRIDQGFSVLECGVQFEGTAEVGQFGVATSIPDLLSAERRAA